MKPICSRQHSTLTYLSSPRTTQRLGYVRLTRRWRNSTRHEDHPGQPPRLLPGVNLAIECLERALDFFGPPVYVYHEIVHNKYVVDRFKGRGTVFVESLDEVPEGSPLLYSTTASLRRFATRPVAVGCLPLTQLARW